MSQFSFFFFFFCIILLLFLSTERKNSCFAINFNPLPCSSSSSDDQKSNSKHHHHISHRKLSQHLSRDEASRLLIPDLKSHLAWRNDKCENCKTRQDFLHKLDRHLKRGTSISMSVKQFSESSHHPKPLSEDEKRIRKQSQPPHSATKSHYTSKMIREAKRKRAVKRKVRDHLVQTGFDPAIVYTGSDSEAIARRYDQKMKRKYQGGRKMPTREYKDVKTSLSTSHSHSYSRVSVKKPEETVKANKEKKKKKKPGDGMFADYIRSPMARVSHSSSHSKIEEDDDESFEDL